MLTIESVTVQIFIPIHDDQRDIKMAQRRSSSAFSGYSRCRPNSVCSRLIAEIAIWWQKDFNLTVSIKTIIRIWWECWARTKKSREFRNEILRTKLCG